MKLKVLDSVGDLFNDLYYIYKDKYNEEKDGLNTKKNKKHFYYKKLRLTDDYQYVSEEKKKKNNNRLVISLIRNNHLKKQQKIMQVNLINGLMKKKEA